MKISDLNVGYRIRFKIKQYDVECIHVGYILCINSDGTMWVSQNQTFDTAKLCQNWTIKAENILEILKD